MRSQLPWGQLLHLLSGPPAAAPGHARRSEPPAASRLLAPVSPCLLGTLTRCELREKNFLVTLFRGSPRAGPVVSSAATDCTTIARAQTIRAAPSTLRLLGGTSSRQAAAPGSLDLSQDRSRCGRIAEVILRLPRRRRSSLIPNRWWTGREHLPILGEACAWHTPGAGPRTPICARGTPGPMTGTAREAPACEFSDPAVRP